MALKITQREMDGVAVMALEGRIVLGEESNALREQVKARFRGQPHAADQAGGHDD